MERGWAFARACQDARDDAVMYGVHRTQEEVMAETKRYQLLEKDLEKEN